ncbi:peptidase M23 [Micromonospora sp. NPDC048909]|uniref:peptidase M23 n=1 Tax=Micromonospora sp. NPDC048909 TaxID=3155643 RepID=UPI0033C22623
MRDDDTPDDPNAPTDPYVHSDDQPSAERPIRWSRLRAAGGIRKLSTAPGRVRVALAAGVVCCLGLAAFAQVGDRTAQADPLAARADLVQRAEQERASRGLDRTPTAEPTAPAATPAAKSAAPAPTRSDPDTGSDRPAKRVAPVAGLSRAQMANAETIVRTGREMGVPRRGLVIAVATAMQESNLYNYASGVLPESQDYPHQAIGWDHDSVGLFQQRPSSGWGPVGRLMDPAFATRQFLTALEQVPGWRQMRLTEAAQAVQVSAYPDLYAQHEWRATEVVDAVAPAGR